MADEKEGAKDAESPAADKDERGVPWEHRAKEFERKYSESQAEVEALKASREVVKEDPQEAVKKELVDFAQDPKGFVSRMLGEEKVRQEIDKVLPFLESQEGYTTDDNSRLLQIEKEYDLRSPSPLARAKTAWAILHREKLAAEREKYRSNADRESAVKTSGPEGSGRSAPKSDTPKRTEILAQLAMSEKKGDLQTSARLVDMLSDVRE